MRRSDAPLEPETLAVLKAAFDEACDALPAGQRSQTVRSYLAGRILELANEGERDPDRLRARALIGVVPATELYLEMS